MNWHSRGLVALAALINFQRALGDQTLLCNSTINQANASGVVTFAVDYPTANSSANGTAGDPIQYVPNPSWAYTVEKDGDSTQSSLWYDTAGQNYSDDVGIGYDACAFVVSSLPQNTVRLGQDDPGDCSSMLSQPCRDTILDRASSSALKWTTYSSPPPYSNLSAGVLPSLCQYILGDLGDDGKTYPKECAKEFGYDYNVNHVNAYNTNVGTLTLALTGYNNSILEDEACTLQDGDKTFKLASGLSYSGTSYDDLARTVVPVLSVYFSVANYAERTSLITYAPSTMSCLRVKDFSEGSRVSTALPAGTPYKYGSSSLSGGAIAGVVVGVLVFVSVVLLLAFWLWRRRRKQAREAQAAVKEGDIGAEEIDGDARHELQEDDRKMEKDSSPISELVGDQKKAGELEGDTIAVEADSKSRTAKLP